MCNDHAIMLACFLVLVIVCRDIMMARAGLTILPVNPISNLEAVLGK